MPAGGSITWRVQLAGADQARAEFKSLGDAGAGAARTTADGWASAGQQTEAEVTRAVRLRDAWREADAQRRQYASELRTSGAGAPATAMQQAQAQASALSSAAQTRYNMMSGVGATSGKSARDSAAAFTAELTAMEQMQARANALRASLSPLVAAQQTYGRAVESAGALLAGGAISEAEHAAAVAAAKKGLQEAEEAARKAGSGFHLTSLQAMELEHSARAMADAMMAGRNPIQALAMEIGRLVQALGQGAGVGGALKMLAGLISPEVVAVGALTAAMLAGAAAAGAYAQAQEHLEISLRGAGRNSGETAEGLERIAEVSGRAGNVSVAAARGMEEAFLSTGRISASVFPAAIAVQRDFATAMGLTSKQATDVLTKALEDPVHGADQLNQSLHFLTDAEMEHVRSLVESGDRTDAQRLLTERLTVAVGGAAAALNPLDQMLHNVSKSMADAWNWTGQLIDKLSHLGSTKLQSLNLQIAVMSSAPLADQGELKRLIAERDAIANADQNKRNADQAEASTRIGAISRQYDPSIQQKRDMQAQLDDLQRQAKTDFRGVAPEERAEAERLLRALPEAIHSVMSQHDRETQEAAIRARLAARPGSAERGQLQEQLVKIQIAGQVLTPEERAAMIASGRLQGENRGARVDQAASRRADAEANRVSEAQKASNDTILRAQEAETKAQETITNAKAAEAKSALDALAGDTTLSASERRARMAQAASELAISNAKDDRLALELKRIDQDKARQLGDVGNQKDWTPAERTAASKAISDSADAQAAAAAEQDRQRQSAANDAASTSANALAAAALKAQSADVGLPAAARVRAEQQLLDLQQSEASARLEEVLAVKGVTDATKARARSALQQSQSAELQLSTDNQVRQLTMAGMEAAKSLATSQEARNAIERQQLAIAQQQRDAATKILIGQLDAAVNAKAMAQAMRDQLVGTLTSAQSNLDASEQEALRRQQLSPLGRLADPSQQPSFHDMAQSDAADASQQLARAFVSLEQNTTTFGKAMKDVVTSIQGTVLKQLTDRALAPLDHWLDQEIDNLFPAAASTGTTAANAAMAQSATLASTAITALANAAAAAATKIGLSGTGGGLPGFSLLGGGADFDSFATGGLFRGAGSGTGDANLARISDGEFIVNARATSQHIDTLHAINSGVRGYASGGYVGSDDGSWRRRMTEPTVGDGGSSGGGDVHIHNHTGVPAKATRSKNSNGDTMISLRPMVEQASRARASDPNGLARDLRLIPQVRKSRP